MTIEERLEVLERELAVSQRRTRRLWISLGLAGAVCALAWSFAAITGCAQAQVDGKVIWANLFIVEDENGKPRAKLDKDGLSLHDGISPLPRAMLSTDKDGTGLLLFNENGMPRALLNTNKDGTGLDLFNENGGFRAWLSADKDKTGLLLFDENGKVIWRAP